MANTDTGKMIRPHLANIQTYKSIDPPELLAQQAGIPESQIVKLNGNENPYGPSPKAIEAVAGAPLHIYPDPQQRKMRQSLSEYTGLRAEHLIAGAGSDELIDLLFRLFIEPGDRILDFDPTFAMYAFCARVCGGELVMLERDEVFEIDMDAVRESIDDRTKIVFVSSPNNPTGNLLPDSQVRELLDTGLIVVVDEAYFEFCGHTVAELVPEYSNLVVLRTMSKWAGLAGLRVGYGIMAPDIVSHIMDIKSPYNVNIAAEVALLASLEDALALQANVDKIVAERTRLQATLEAMPGITPWPSEGNFILCQMPDAAEAERVYNDLASSGVFVRNFASERLKDSFRVAVGTIEETDAFVAALRECVR
ncbi:MAG: histidinol-phosphate transaminase [SAR202 cluster bacterium]|nr:histidinol-phosphate transaminase [SAR202 cluster bacterium]MDP6301897.1 histidinol-phosphate transaminase [SAR202 cluster bacterium]MDP7104745.1 histidinol-phosphate transaminase [SAR202 cluster bacterium]MDP7226067.1 histidinol-phosphate transaminase [SAR202 cluster bacterium]MDP7413414.1 histidinol-phosphate transaminase [SAR202 cluster bacterium]